VLESAGRLLIGTIAFVFCAAHLGLMVQNLNRGEIELFGVLAIGSELPQRLTGRFRPGEDFVRPLVGSALGAALALGLGVLLGPLGGVTGREGAVAGLLVAVGTAGGALLAEAVAQDLNWGRRLPVGRGAFLDRTLPAILAAPAFFHYLTCATSTP